MLAACVPASTVHAETVEYVCGNGQSFTATFRGDRVVILTSAARYLMRRRGGSLERYGSAGAAFVRDGEDGFLVGASGGPYADCKSVRKVAPASAWTSDASHLGGRAEVRQMAA